MHNKEEYWTMYCENVDLRKCRMNFTPLCPKSFMSYKKIIIDMVPIMGPGNWDPKIKCRFSNSYF